MHRDETQCRPTPAAQSPATMACMAFPSRKPSPTLNESVVRGPFHPFFPYHRPFPITFSSAICSPSLPPLSPSRRWPRQSLFLAKPKIAAYVNTHIQAQDRNPPHPHCGHCHWTPDAGFVACLRNVSDRLVRLRAILTLCRPPHTAHTRRIDPAHFPSHDPPLLGSIVCPILSPLRFTLR